MDPEDEKYEQDLAVAPEDMFDGTDGIFSSLSLCLFSLPYIHA